MNGAFAGLAAVTPGSGFVMPWAAVLIGACGSATAFCWVSYVKPRLHVDDALDVCALQGVPGILGTVAVGFFAELYTSDSNDSSKLGILRGGDGTLLVTQLLGVGVTIIWTASLTYILMQWMKKYVGIDVSPECEEKGLDLVQIGEQGKRMRSNLTSRMLG
jgi:ammonium transporter, Amt family|tara:strand:+ start:946 stop:1428 length:483 start_codon:yes stop_codon:yes gene_type:complete